MKLGAQPIRRRRRVAPPAEGAWSVVLVDSSAIRRKARRDYEKVLRDLDVAKAETERFENEDKPQFAKWLSANFGALLTEMRELQEKLFHAQDLVNEVQQEFYFGNYRSINKAYQNVMHRRNHPEPVEAESKEVEGEAEEEQFRREFEEVFGRIEEEFWERTGGNPADSRRSHEKLPQTQGSRLKDQYRKLVRLLHPDKGAKRSAKEIEWWHQTQEAYESGNLEQLELILTLVEMENKGTKEASVSALSQLTLEFKKSLKALKRKIGDFKKDIAWNFSQATDFTALLARTRSQLQADRDRVVWLLQKYEAQIQSWETAAAGSRKRVRARRGNWADEEWF